MFCAQHMAAAIYWRDCSELKQDRIVHEYMLNLSGRAVTATLQLFARMWLQRQSKAMHQRPQIYLQWHLWIVFFTIFMSTSPNSCSGAYSDSYLSDIICCLHVSHYL